MLANPPQLLNTLVPFYILNMDHSSYSRSGEQPLGKWDVWLNVLNVELENASTELELYEVFYGPLSEEPMAWRATSAFYSCVLRPLCWAGVLIEHRDKAPSVRMLCISKRHCGLRGYSWIRTAWSSPHSATDCSVNCAVFRQRKHTAQNLIEVA